MSECDICSKKTDELYEFGGYDELCGECRDLKEQEWEDEQRHRRWRFRQEQERYEEDE